VNSVDACYRELVAGEVRIKSANQVVARSAPGQSLSFSRICTVEASSTLPTSKGECGGRRAHHLIYVQPAPRRAIMASQGQLSSAEAIFHPSRLAYGLTPTLFTLKTYVLIVRHLWHRTHVLFGARFQAECHACSPTTRAGPPGAPPPALRRGPLPRSLPRARARDDCSASVLACPPSRSPAERGATTLADYAAAQSPAAPDRDCPSTVRHALPATCRRAAILQRGSPPHQRPLSSTLVLIFRTGGERWTRELLS